MIVRSFAAGLLIATATAGAQSSAAVAELVESARAATNRFENRRVAVAAGYRRAGRDMPSMGEHWINPRLLMDNKLDPAKPAVLTYLPVNGKAILTGVVYAVVLGRGESPPSIFGPDAKWHEHNGSIDDEALSPEHATPAGSHKETRVAFLHVWLRIPSPQGMFAAENWAIPFVRAGIAVPGSFPNGAARAVSLVTGGKEFFLDLAGSAAAPVVTSALSECESAVVSIVDAARDASRALTAEELFTLDRLWISAIQRIAVAAGSNVASRINGGPEAHDHHGLD